VLTPAFSFLKALMNPSDLNRRDLGERMNVDGKMNENIPKTRRKAAP
jgi:hypothetical protein